MNNFSRKSQKSFASIFGWMMFAAALLALLIYGLSFFAAESTVETITTQPTAATPATNTQNLKYQQPKRKN